MHSAGQALIGPNAIIQMVQALSHQLGTVETRRLLEAAHLGHYIDHPPGQMVPEAEVAALHAQVYRDQALADFKRIAAEAGLRTGDYLLANRIPGPVQWVLKRLPDAIAARLLSRAIAKHAWTFAGSGVFTYAWRPNLTYSIQGNPITAGLQAQVPICDYYAATFERIFRQLVNDDWRVVERACEASGAPACLFEMCPKAS